MRSIKHVDVAIIGGGAAGFFAGITIAESSPKARICIIEKSNHVLNKVKISGGGRCNITNACFDPKILASFYPRGSKELLSVFYRFNPQNTIKWFEDRYVPTIIEPDGRVFPKSNSSETVLKCLLSRANDLGISIYTGTNVSNIKLINSDFIKDDLLQKTSDEKYFELIISKNNISNKNSHIENIISKNILMATGGNTHSFELAKNLGHSIIDPVPSIFTFEIKDPRIENLPGVSVPIVSVSLVDDKNKPILAEQKGALLITHWGLSGPAILKLSAFAARVLFENNYHAKLAINWMPNISEIELTNLLIKIKEAYPKKRIHSQILEIPFPTRLWSSLLSHIGIKEEDTWANISKKLLMSLKNEIMFSIFQITAKGVFKDEFVTSGGVSLKEVNFKTMESKKQQNLYFAGEILDIDGVTGGFNFQNAWSTGWIAGMSLAEKLSLN